MDRLLIIVDADVKPAAVWREGQELRRTVIGMVVVT
jgi:hypothetical protein